MKIALVTAGHHRLNLDAARTNLAALFDEADSPQPWDKDSEDDGLDFDADSDANTVPLQLVDSKPDAAAPVGLLAAAKLPGPRVRFFVGLCRQFAEPLQPFEQHGITGVG